VKTELLAVAIVVALCGPTLGQDPNMDAVRGCISAGVKASIPVDQYQQMLGRIAALPRTEMIVAWAKEYGLNNLSTFVACSEPFERRVFALDYLTSPPEIACAVFGEASHGRHVCEASDIGGITISYSGEERGVGVVAGQVTVERPLVYRAFCCFVATRRQPDGAWRLEFLGVANRLSSDIRLSRPVFVRSDRWDEIDFQLHSLGIPLSLPTEQFRTISPSSSSGQQDRSIGAGNNGELGK
jgi:hypothetical protein